VNDCERVIYVTDLNLSGIQLLIIPAKLLRRWARHALRTQALAQLAGRGAVLGLDDLFGGHKGSFFAGDAIQFPSLFYFHLD